MNSFASLRKSCIESGEFFPIVLMKSLYYRSRGKRIFAHQHCSISGLENIAIGNRLDIGLSYRGFTHRSDRTYLNVLGKMEFKSNYNIGRGCRFDIGTDGSASFGNGFVNPNSLFIVMHRLEVGDGTVISWNCQFIDDDFHNLRDPGRPAAGEHDIRVGEHVWIGCNVIVLKGSIIPNGCVVAAGSIVTQPFEEENCLIAGTPARVVRSGIAWD
jgi:acetyltransferase-like isoleucine patch superfamily enzyme